MTADMMKRVADAVDAARSENPLAGSMTNAVTMGFVANAQLAVGGSAAMVYLQDEGEFLAKVGDSFYINVGTLLPLHKESMLHAAGTLHDIRKRWVLDPVAVGIGSLRRDILLGFKEFRPSVIRGNASEIKALAGLWGLDGADVSNVRGVDSTDDVIAAKDAAVALAEWTGGAVAVSGEVDMVTDGKLIVRSYGGSHFMEKITGAGCSLGGVMAVYAAVAEPFIAAVAGTAIYNLAGRRAQHKANGPGSFQSIFLDELYNASAKDVSENRMEITEVRE